MVTPYCRASLIVRKTHDFVADADSPGGIKFHGVDCDLPVRYCVDDAQSQAVHLHGSSVADFPAPLRVERCRVEYNLKFSRARYGIDSSFRRYEGDNLPAVCGFRVAREGRCACLVLNLRVDIAG